MTEIQPQPYAAYNLIERVKDYTCNYDKYEVLLSGCGTDWPGYSYAVEAVGSKFKFPNSLPQWLLEPGASARNWN